MHCCSETFNTNYFFMNILSKYALIPLMGIMLAAPAFAKSERGEERGRGDDYRVYATSTIKVGKAVDLVCVQNAITKREDAVMATIDTATTALKNAMTVRKTSLVAAWKIENRKDRNVAIKAAWSTFKTSIREINATRRTAVKTVWNTFKTERRVCGPSAGEPSESQGIDQG